MNNPKTVSMMTVAESLAGSKTEAIRLLVDTFLDAVAELVDRVPAPPQAATNHAAVVGEVATVTVAEAAQRLNTGVATMHHLTRAGYTRRWPAGKLVNYEIPAEDVERLERTERSRWQPIYGEQAAKRVHRQLHTARPS